MNKNEQLEKLEQEKMALVSQLNRVQEKIDSYGLLDIATDSGLFKDDVLQKQSIEYKIKEINQKILSFK